MTGGKVVVGQLTHAIRWFGVVQGSRGRERIARTRHMPGRDWGWDAACSCGWDTRTGGATQASIRRDIREHRMDVSLGTFA